MLLGNPTLATQRDLFRPPTVDHNGGFEAPLLGCHYIS